MARPPISKKWLISKELVDRWTGPPKRLLQLVMAKNKVPKVGCTAHS